MKNARVHFAHMFCMCTNIQQQILIRLQKPHHTYNTNNLVWDDNHRPHIQDAISDLASLKMWCLNAKHYVSVGAARTTTPFYKPAHSTDYGCNVT